MAGVTKVLVLMTSPLDKIVHAARIVDRITRERPHLEITWVVRRFYEPVVSTFPFVKRTVVFRRRGALVKAVGLVRGIRREEYDFVLDFEGHARTGAMCFFAKGKRKIGLHSAREGATICYREIVGDAAVEANHLVDQFRDFGSVFGVNIGKLERLRILEAEDLPRVWSEAAEVGRKRICLFPGRFKIERAWLGMEDLARKLVGERDDVEVYLLGLAPWRSSGSHPKRLHDLHGKLSWSQIVTMLRAADLVVANDNGPAQLAGALGCKNLTLYTFVSRDRRGSYPIDNPINSGLQAPGGRPEKLTVESVFREVSRLLSN